jgi:hypothetical protein
MGAAAHRDAQPMIARKIHRPDDIGSAGTAGDQCRAPVEHAVPQLARGVVGVVAGLK